MSYRTVLLMVGALPLVLTAVSFVAGERMEVVVLRTLDGNGIAHETKLWIVDHEGRGWVRSARPLRWRSPGKPDRRISSV